MFGAMLPPRACPRRTAAPFPSLGVCRDRKTRGALAAGLSVMGPAAAFLLVRIAGVGIAAVTVYGLVFYVLTAMARA